LESDAAVAGNAALSERALRAARSEAMQAFAELSAGVSVLRQLAPGAEADELEAALDALMRTELTRDLIAGETGADAVADAAPLSDLARLYLQVSTLVQDFGAGADLDAALDTVVDAALSSSAPMSPGDVGAEDPKAAARRIEARGKLAAALTVLEERLNEAGQEPSTPAPTKVAIDAASASVKGLLDRVVGVVDTPAGRVDRGQVERRMLVDSRAQLEAMAAFRTALDAYVAALGDEASELGEPYCLGADDLAQLRGETPWTPGLAVDDAGAPVSDPNRVPALRAALAALEPGPGAAGDGRRRQRPL
jgi:hypothetical protein